MNFLDSLFTYNSGDKVIGLTDELNAIYVVNLFRKQNQNIIVLTSSLYEANNYFNLLQTYSDDVLLFVVDDFLSSVIKSASPELKLTRLNTIEKMSSGKHIIVANLMGYLKFLPSLKNTSNRYLNIKVNSSLKRNDLVNYLIENGYKKESLTTSTGEFSVRGMVVDLYPINEIHPIRIEFDDDNISKIKIYDENSQITINTINDFVLKPVDEIDSIEYSSIIDYLKDPTIVKIDRHQIDASYNKLSEDLLEYKKINNNKLMYSYEELIETNVIELNKFDSQGSIKYDCKSIDNFNEDYDLLKQFIAKYYNTHIIYFFLSNKKEINKIKKELSNYLNINYVQKKINKGFIIDKYIVISEFDIEEIEHNYKYQNSLYGGKKIVNSNELHIGDYVVHYSHGIGQYNGITTLTKDGIKKDYIQLLYLNNDKIYVPVEKITNIYKYSDKDGSVPKLNKLNSSTWLKTRAFVKKKIEDIAFELMELYKARALIVSNKYKTYPEEDIFSASFAYNLTDDQQKAINDINADLSSSIPMDRLLCGDVGFGKTEVALRAMFKAVLNNEQVAYLCPTTILSKQQYKVAKERFRDWPIEIALLNRFSTPKEIKKIYEGLEKGKYDIVFGTHKLLNDKIRYKNLGLLVVDEEQRFGVKHKEKIKELKNNVNVLTLSATPIPRTLKMALSGLRDLSIIETPPLNRYPVQTYVTEEDDFIIKDAIYKELSRNGQIFILYNNVSKIADKVSHLKKLIPGIEIRYAHGQMDKDELDTIMDDFIQKKFSVLLCTTIIENGIDIPNANTLIVYDADKLGLSQLYQLRGRVGRGDRIAYAYLLYNKLKSLNDDAIKRLKAISEFTELGSGYRIAMRDLSIRGAGDIFGSSQAGFVDEVGVSLYTKLIEDEIKKQKGEFVEEIDDENPNLFNVDTHISDEYVSEDDIKIEIHQMINEIDSYDKLSTVKENLEDRFGKIDEKLENYMYEEWFEKIAKKIGITKIIQTDRMIEIELPESICNNIKGDKLLYEAYSICPDFKLEYKHKCILIRLYYKNLQEHFIKYVVRLLNTL